MGSIRHSPSEASEQMPKGVLAIFGYRESGGQVHYAYLSVPKSSPPKGYVFDLDSGQITDVIEDLQFDRYSRAAKHLPQTIRGSYIQLTQKLIKARQISQERSIDFQTAVGEVEKDEIRETRNTISRAIH
jgi:hypothetical protein